jgi:hypothetical protein
MTTVCDDRRGAVRAMGHEGMEPWSENVTAVRFMTPTPREITRRQPLRGEALGRLAGEIVPDVQRQLSQVRAFPAELVDPLSHDVVEAGADGLATSAGVWSNGSAKRLGVHAVPTGPGSRN